MKNNKSNGSNVGNNNKNNNNEKSKNFNNNNSEGRKRRKEEDQKTLALLQLFLQKQSVKIQETEAEIKHLVDTIAMEKITEKYLHTYISLIDVWITTEGEIWYPI